LEGNSAIEKVVSLDMPGCGTKRTRETSKETLVSIAAELNQDIRNAGVERVVLVGHSIAGILLPMMVVGDPSLFSKLVYLSCSLPLEGESVMQMMGTALHGQDPDKVGWPQDPLNTPPIELAVAMFGRDLSEEQLSWLMGEISQDSMPGAVNSHPATRKGYGGRIPATYILTKRDPILPPEWQRQFAQRALCSSIVEIDTPHEPFVSHPELLVETLIPIITG
jgi:pimeloyl-ACP methyl ester carboxylesterase